MILSIIGMCFAAEGYIAPVMGAIIQEVIDVLAIMNALRLASEKNISIDLPLYGT
jgi:cation transport ATPase